MKKRTSVAVVFVLLCSTIAITQTAAAPAQTPAQKSLYQRLGGYDAIAAVTDDFFARLGADPQFKRFFGGFNDQSSKRIRQHTVDFLCEITGGPCAYHGRDMKTTHKGLSITQAEWDVSVKHLTATLDKFKVPEKEKNEVLTAVGGLKKDIVEKP